MRKINFNSGPSVLPEEVLQLAAEGILNLNNEGVSVAEISHRSKLFTNILEEFIALIRELLHLTNDHEIIILQGGARLQFAQIPMNFLSSEKTAGFIDTGYWAHTAMEYTAFYGNIHLIASSQDKGYSYIPDTGILPENLEYVQLTSNNTIYGTQYKVIPEFKIPVVIDMSSDILSIERNFENIDFAFACAQKNIGPAGVSVAIVKRPFLEKANTGIAPVFSYKNLAAKQSNYATPPVVNIYMALLNLRWLKTMGGVNEIQKLNQIKAGILYQEIERNALFECKVNKANRSCINVCFFSKNESIQTAFLDFCAARGIIGIRGHKAAGGLRASIYNAQPPGNVQYLAEMMKEFEKNSISLL